MNFIEKDVNISIIDIKKTKSIEDSNQEKILCIHCKRSLTNKQPCIGMCLADSEY